MIKAAINRLSIFGIVLFLGALGAFAQAIVPAQTTAFNYQGRLVEGASAANGTYEMEFLLFDAASGGAQAGATVTLPAVVVTNGVFAVSLDFGAAAFPGADRYLEVRVKKPIDPAFTTLAPRQPIASVPYAVRAASVAAGAGNDIVSALNDSSTNTTISSAVLPADLVRTRPAASQTAIFGDFSEPFVDLTARANARGVFGDVGRFRLNGDGGFFVAGTTGLGAVPTSGAGTRMMWYPGKWAFRAGKVDSFGATYWDESNVGLGSAAFGENSRASGDSSFAAGLATNASGNESVALGNNGTASADRAMSFNGTASGVGAVALGSGAQATSDDALALGPSSIAGGLASIAIGPSIANGNFGVAIGLQNRAMGNFSVAIGKNATSCGRYDCDPAFGFYSGVVTIGDGCAGFSSDAVTASANNQINIRGCGGFRFFTNQQLTTGVQLAAGGGAWSSLSDRNAKENFAAVNSRDVLGKVLKLPISTWNYKSQDRSIRHIGAMAQDFFAAFGVGESDKMIATIDPDGVAFAAIQGLNEKLEEEAAALKKENAELRQRLEAQQTRLEAQQGALDALKKLVCAGNRGAAVCR